MSKASEAFNAKLAAAVAALGAAVASGWIADGLKGECLFEPVLDACAGNVAAGLGRVLVAGAVFGLSVLFLYRLAKRLLPVKHLAWSPGVRPHRVLIAALSPLRCRLRTGADGITHAEGIGREGKTSFSKGLTGDIGKDINVFDDVRPFWPGQHFLRAFAGAEARPVLRLHRSGRDGADQVIANAELGDDAAAQDSLAHYDGTGGDGLLRAEIGLAGDSGGWMLIARSNGLPAAVPVGVEFLHADAAVPARLDAQLRAQDDQALPAADAAGQPTAAQTKAPAPVWGLAAEFPLVEPVLSLLAEIAALGGTLAVDADAATQALPTSPAALHLGLDIGTAAAVSSPAEGLPPGALRAPEEPPPGGVVPRLRQRPAAVAARVGPAGGPAAHLGLAGASSLQETIAGIPFLDQAELVVIISGIGNVELVLGHTRDYDLYGAFFSQHLYLGTSQTPVRQLSAPGAFTPAPKVDSAVVHLVPLRPPPIPIADPALPGRIVAAAFCLVGADSLYGRHWGCFQD